jgi:transposase-like protein
MVRTHPSTPEERAQWTAHMLAHQGEYGVITRLSRDSGVSRPTLYAWRQAAERALLQTFTPPTPPPPSCPSVERQVLTLWSAHSSDRDIQTCFRTLTQQGIGLTRISAILAEAEQRAVRYLATHMPPTVRAVALDELYTNDRHGAYLTIADVHSGAVWACVGPVGADSDSWTLLLWEAQDYGLVVDRAVMDGGAAARAGCQRVLPALVIQSDQWHVLHSGAALQGRLDRILHAQRARAAVVARQAARLAAGQRPKGRNPQTDVAAHAAQVQVAERVADAVRYLRQELRRLLDVVVLDHRGVLNAQQRQADLDALLDLLAEVAEGLDAPLQGLVRQVHALVKETLPSLLTFVAQLAQLQADLSAVLGPASQALLGWAWLHRRVLGWQRAHILAAIPADWRAAARILLAAWEDVVRVSTAVERWHSILRVHLSVHRTMSPGRLALLVMWHNHRVFARGIHKGQHPLQLSGIADAPTDWLVALGYPPARVDRAPAASAVALAA